jgi:hypothetical protein
LQHVSGQDYNSTNEFYYWIYCYGRTQIAPEAEPGKF